MIPAAVPRYHGRRVRTGPSALLLRLLTRPDLDRSEAHLARLLDETERDGRIAAWLLWGLWTDGSCNDSRCASFSRLVVTWGDKMTATVEPAAPLCRDAEVMR